MTSIRSAPLLALLTATAAAQAPGPAPKWRMVAEVPLPGPAGRFDYQSFDSSSTLLWLAHMAAGEVLAFDVGSRRVVARVSGMAGATGVLAVPSLRRVFVSLSEKHQVAVLDAHTGRVLSRVEAGRFPDGLAYAPSAHKLFVSDEYGRQELVIDAASSVPLPPIPMNGEVGNTQYDPVSGRIWVAVQTRDQLAAIDPATDAVVARVAVPGIERPHGLVIDAVHQLAYVAGEGNGRLGVLDLRTGRLLETYPVGDEPDVLAIDVERGRLFVASESGAIAAFQIRGERLIPLATYRAPHAHSVALDPRTHLLYVPLAQVNGRPLLRILELEED